MTQEISYSNIVSFRSKVSEKFPKPIRKPRTWSSYSCKSTVLNFGSGKKDSANNRELISVYGNVKTCDSDPEAFADYCSIDQIEEKFGLIVAEHVIEHIDTPFFVNTLSKRFSELLEKNGKLIITIPNLYCYGTFFSDFDHKNLCGHLDIACILCSKGLEIIDYFLWSKLNYMALQSNFSESEKKLELFMEKNYGLQTDRYVTLVFEKR